MRLSVTAAPDSTGAIFVRAAPGNREVPTADLRFRRNEQVRVEIPTASSDPLTARLLDRNGKPLAVPVTAAVRDDADGSRWQTAQLALAPLAPADYVIELTAGSRQIDRGVSRRPVTQSQSVAQPFRAATHVSRLSRATQA